MRPNRLTARATFAAIVLSFCTPHASVPAQASPRPITVPLSPGVGIDDTIESADRFADQMASVNTSTCLSPTTFSAKRTAMDQAVLDYVRAGGFRHVREGFAGVCYNSAAFERWWADAYRFEHITRSGGVGVGYTAAQIAGLAANDPGLEAIGFGNEWDAASQPTNGNVKLATPAHAGDTSLDVGGSSAFAWLIPGQSYTLDDGGARETVTLARSLPNSLSIATLAAPLRAAHAAGASLRRVGDFVGDVARWYALYPAAIRHANPSIAILGASMAHPIDNNQFGTDGVSLGRAIDVLDAHPYPVDGDNPEGVAGDGYQSDIAIAHPPCSYRNTSYSFMFNAACEESVQSGMSMGRLPLWLTEYSYQVVPVGAAHSSVWPQAVPDDVGVDYLTGSEVYAATHGVARLFWFQLRDGTSGPNSGFCTYGLLRDASCSSAYPAAVKPKPELLALMSLIGYFSDPLCAYPACGSATGSFSGTWQPASLPLDTANFAFASGKTTVAFWLGARSYDSHTNAPCAATSSCYVAVAPRAETFSSPLLAHARAYLTGIDDDRNDPLPNASTLTLPDNVAPASIVKCPNGPTLTPEFGCILPRVPLTISNGSVTVQASRRLQWIEIDPL